MNTLDEIMRLGRNIMLGATLLVSNNCGDATTANRDDTCKGDYVAGSCEATNGNNYGDSICQRYSEICSQEGVEDPFEDSFGQYSCEDFCETRLSETQCISFCEYQVRNSEKGETDLDFRNSHDYKECVSNNCDNGSENSDMCIIMTCSLDSGFCYEALTSENVDNVHSLLECVERY
jgi:hypothetical protein